MTGVIVPIRDNESLPPAPHAFQVEMALLGAILCDNSAYSRVAALLRPEHFADVDHGALFGAMGEIIEDGGSADALTLMSYFAADAWESKGGPARFLADLGTAPFGVRGAAHWGRVIFDLWQRRAIIYCAADLDEWARGVAGSERATDIIARGEAALSLLTGDGGFSAGTRSLADVSASAVEMAEAAHKQDRAVIGLSSGFEALDKRIAGLRPGQLIIIGGRPGMGKSDLALNIALRVSKALHKTLFFSLEMSAEELAFRAIAERSGVPASTVLAGSMESHEPGLVFDAAAEIGKLSMIVNDEPALSVSQIRAIARRHEPELVVVDYLQLIPAAEQGERYQNDVSRVTAISQALKAMAKSLKVPVIALCQLNRAVEARDDKRPMLSDLRESGSIEQDADVVMFLYREEYYKSRDRPKSHASADRWAAWKSDLEALRGKAEIQIAKQRMGPTGRINLIFDGAKSSFSEPEDDGQESMEF